MAVGIRVRTGDWPAYVSERRSLMEKAVTAGVKAATDGAKLELNQQTDRVLGRMLWNGRTYPERGTSLGAAGFLFPRRGAEKIVEAFSDGVTITAKKGKYLAIPTENVPRAAGQGRGGRKRMTPEQVEDRFNQDLQLVPSRTRPGTAYLVLRNVVAGRKRGTLRQATARRRAQGRAARPVIMFVLVRRVTLRKTLDPVSLVAKWAGLAPALIERAIPEGL